MFLKSFLLYYIAAVMCTLSLNINVSAIHLCFNLFIVHTKPRKLFHLIRIYWCFSGWKWLVISTINIFSDSSFSLIFKLCVEDVPSGGEVHWIQLFNGKNNLISKYHNIPEHQNTFSKIRCFYNWQLKWVRIVYEWDLAQKPFSTYSSNFSP